MTTLTLTGDEIRRLDAIIMTVWQAIAPDAEESCDGDNECAIEMCLDADRPATFSRPEDNDWCKALCKRVPFSVVCEQMARKVHLV